MFAPHTLPAGTIDHALRRRREARLRALRAYADEEARARQGAMQVLREADDEGDWKAAGCSSSEQWFAQVYGTTHQTAMAVTHVAEALRALPALNETMGSGALTFDQVAASVEHATPETDAQIARLAVGKAPGKIALEVRKLNPPKVADDRELYRRRKTSMTWTNGKRELIVHARLPLEQGVVFENGVWDAAKLRRAAEKQDGIVLEWQQSTADALVELVRGGTENGSRSGSGSGNGRKRAPALLVVHISEDSPAILQGSGPISDETAERLTCDASRLLIQPLGDDIVYRYEGRTASTPQKLSMLHRSGHCQYPGCTATRDLEAHHATPWRLGGKTRVRMMFLLCPRHHDWLHEQGITTSGTGDDPIFTSADGDLITANQPHAPPS